MNAIHKKGSTLLFILSIALVLLSCQSDLRVVVPDFESLETLQGTKPVPDTLLRLIDGVYELSEGATHFGQIVVLKSSDTALSVFCGKNVAYMVLRSGIKDSVVRFAGYWRDAQSPQTGLCVLDLTKGARELRKGIRPPVIELSGKTGDADGNLNNTITMKYLRPLYNKALRIIAHRGGGRNSDRLPFSENSVELIRFAPKLGATGVEIDVRLTKDGIPILYHDENFNTRLVDGEYMVGPVGNYTYTQIQELCKLKNGERVPTLEEALQTIVNETHLSFVWLDIKESASVEKVVALQKKYLALAEQLRPQDSLHINFGLPADDIYHAFQQQPEYHNIPSVCELGIEQTRNAGSKCYAPRWTLGTLNGDVQQLHNEGREVLVWTLDQPDFIIQFLRDGNFDGILTNYPTLVAFHHYSRLP